MEKSKDGLATDPEIAKRRGAKRGIGRKGRGMLRATDQVQVTCHFLQVGAPFLTVPSLRFSVILAHIKSSINIRNLRVVPSAGGH